MAWATEVEALALTSLALSAESLALASAIIDTYTGADEDMPADAINVRDRKHLRKATIWQAAWMAGKPGLLSEREASKDIAGDGQRVTREAISDVMLAPLASRELRNLSWVGTRTVVVPTAGDRLGVVNFLNERSDSYGVWSPV